MELFFVVVGSLVMFISIIKIIEMVKNDIQKHKRDSEAEREKFVKIVGHTIIKKWLKDDRFNWQCSCGEKDSHPEQRVAAGLFNIHVGVMQQLEEAKLLAAKRKEESDGRFEW